MKTLYLRNVPDDVVRRLQRLAEREGSSVNAVAIRELRDVSWRVDNADLFGDLSDLDVDVSETVAALDQERTER